MKKKPQSTCPQWMVTMGDCMSLLVTFFVLLLTFSTIKEDQLMELIGVMNGALNVIDDVRLEQASSDEVPEIEGRERMNQEKDKRGRFEEHLVDPSTATPVSLHSQKLSRQFRKLRDRLHSLGFAHEIELEMLEEGVVLHLREETVFKPGTSTLRPEALAILAAFAELANSVGNEVRVMTLQPPEASPRDAEAWGQALARPLAISRDLSSRGQVPPHRISYGLGAHRTGEENYVDLVLVDAIGILEVDVEDVVRFNNTSW